MNTFSPERKILLDSILEKNQTDIVGKGYIDIIVSRSNYINLIKELVFENFKIRSVSWWEWCPENKECEYGLGGPESRFYAGYYAELPIGVDDIDLNTLLPMNDKTKIADYIVTFIERKEIKYPDELIKFQAALWLTPGLWLEVPKNWENVQPQ